MFLSCDCLRWNFQLLGDQGFALSEGSFTDSGTFLLIVYHSLYSLAMLIKARL